MRLAAVLLVASGALAGLAGCVGDDGPGQLRSFKAVYERPDGGRSTVEFGEVRTLLGPDGELRRAYTVRWANGGWEDSWGLEALDAGLRPVRSDRCWVWDEDRRCGHRETWFRNGTGVSQWGVAGPWRSPETMGQRDGLVTVEAWREGLSTYEYEYRPGEPWAQRFVRRAADFGFEEEFWRLVSVEPGPVLPADADAWPETRAAAEAPGPAPLAFPGADQMFQPFPFTVQQGIDALGADAGAGKALAGGCVARVWYWAPFPFEEPPVTLPPLQPTDEDSMLFVLHDAAGIPSNWEVAKVRSTLGQESLEVRARDPDPWSKPFPCATRDGVAVAADRFGASLPAGLRTGRFSQFAAEWSALRDGGGIHLQYNIQWEPEDRSGHWRSGDIDATTGLWTRFTYLPGDQVDP